MVGFGIIFGAAGMRRLGGVAARLSGRWRPGAGLAALIALLGAGGLAARGAPTEGAVLAVVGAGLALAARRRPQQAPLAAGNGMDAREAQATLGVGPEADEAAIEAAYRRLMRRVHPDLGGAAGLAARLNAARAVLLGTSPRA